MFLGTSARAGPIRRVAGESGFWMRAHRVSGRSRVGRPRLRWMPAVTVGDTAERDGGEIAVLTRYMDLRGWPAGIRLLG